MIVEQTTPSESPRAAPPAAEGSWRRAPAALRFAGDGGPWQRSLRWERTPPDRRWFLGGLIAALLVTLLELLGFGLGMRDKNLPRAPQSVQPIEVILIDEALPPIPPEPMPAPFVARPTRVEVSPPQTRLEPPPLAPEQSSDAMQARIGAADSGQLSGLLNADGSVRLEGALPIAPARARNEREAAIARWTEIEARGNPTRCRKTRFAEAFRRDESTGDRVARKYLSWVGLADMRGIEERHQQRSESGGCEPAAP